MAQRRILRLDGTTVEIAREEHFESELRLHQAIAEHPAVLPFEDLHLGPLVAVANELDLGAGPMDLLAVDPTGRLVVVEFKKGSENSDVRKVVAQVLDYGAALWQLPYESLEQQARDAPPPYADTLADHVEGQLAKLEYAGFDAGVFQRGVEQTLQSGNFVFLYVARDLDARTQRIMRFLSDGARMTFFAVEVDYFHAGSSNNAVLVPRTAFVPAWLTERSSRPSAPPFEESLGAAPSDFRQLVANMDAAADALKIIKDSTKTARVYRPFTKGSGINVYPSSGRVEVDLASFRDRGESETAEQLLARLTEIAGKEITATQWPSVSYKAFALAWDHLGRSFFEEYFILRIEHHGEANATEEKVKDLHTILANLSAGTWTTYRDVAATIGSHPIGVGSHLRSCTACPNAHRVLQSTGVPASGFTWMDPTRTESPRALLEAEGVPFIGVKSDPTRRLASDDLRDLLSGPRLTAT